MYALSQISIKWRGERQVIDTILVSVNFANNDDEGVLIVGRKRMNQSVEVINAFQGKEAKELYKKLITKKDGDKK